MTAIVNDLVTRKAKQVPIVFQFSRFNGTGTFHWLKVTLASVESDIVVVSQMILSCSCAIYRRRMLGMLEQVRNVRSCPNPE